MRPDIEHTQHWRQRQSRDLLLRTLPLRVGDNNRTTHAQSKIATVDIFTTMNTHGGTRSEVEWSAE